MKQLNSSGVKFIRNLGKAENGNSIFLCECPECGSEIKLYSSHYYRGSNSCKCRYIAKTNKRLYSIWINMKTRCYNPNVRGYRDYGGRGITICDEWKFSFKAFYEWAVTNGYSDTLSIDRKDVNGNYDPNNCKWSDTIEQANNKRNTIYIHGMSLRKYCRENNLNYKTVQTMKTRHPEMSVDEIVRWYLDRAIKELEDEQT